VPPQLRPQPTCAFQTHVASQPATQQYESTSQIFLAQGSHVLERGRPTAQSECTQAVGPQSLGQVPEVSWGSQAPLPQLVVQAPQSLAHSAQLSPRKASHSPSPQVVAHAPQSREQDPQLSPSEHTPSPQPIGQAPQSRLQLPHVSPAQK
jgi:hypothetical protein